MPNESNFNQTKGRYFYRLFVVAMLLILLQHMISVHFGVPATLSRLGDKIVLMVFGIYVFLARNRRFELPELPYLLICIAVIIGLLPLLISERLSLGLLQAVLTFQAFIALIVFSNMKITGENTVELLHAILILGFFVFMVGLVEYFFPDFYAEAIQKRNYLWTWSRGDYRSLQSIFSHPGVLAWFLSFCFSISVAMLSVYRRFRYLLYSVIFLCGVFLTLRRKSIIACLVVVLLCVFLQKRSKSNLVGFSMLIIGVAGLFFLGGEQIAYLVQDTIAKYQGESGFAMHPRVELASNGFFLAIDRFPFGSGLGTFGSYVSSMDYSPIYYELSMHRSWGLSPNYPAFITDTYWPMILGEFGLIGTLIVVTIWGKIYLKTIRNFKVSQRHLQPEVVVVMLSSVLVMTELFIESIAQPSLSRSPQTTLSFIVVGLSYSLSKKFGRPVSGASD